MFNYFLLLEQLSEDPISCLHEFVVAPGGMLSGRGNILVYLNNMVFHVLKGNLMLHDYVTICPLFSSMVLVLIPTLLLVNS